MIPHYSARAYCDIVHRFPGRFCCRALCDTFWCYAVIMVHRAPRSRAGFHICLALCGDWHYAVLWCVPGIRRFETFWCYAVLWRHRQAGDHIFLCPMHNLYFGNKHFDIFLYVLFSIYLIRLLFRFISIPSALHTQYIFRTDPLLRGLRFMPAGTDAQPGDPPV